MPWARHFSHSVPDIAVWRSEGGHADCSLNEKESKLVGYPCLVSGNKLGLVVTASGFSEVRKGAQADQESSAPGDLGSAGGRGAHVLWAEFNPKTGLLE